MKVDFAAVKKAFDDTDQTVHYLLDRQTGKVLSLSLHDKAAVADVQKKLAADKGRYLQIPKAKPRANFEEVERFVAGLSDPHFKQQLQRAMASHRPFREFRDALATKPQHARAWEAFHEENLDKQARAFLKSVGLD